MTNADRVARNYDDEGNRYVDAVHDMTRRRIMSDNAHRERQIRSDLIEDVKSAIEHESDRMGNEIGCSDDVHQVFAEAAVDAVADYYRRQVTREPS